MAGPRGSRDGQQISPAIAGVSGVQLTAQFLEQRGEVLAVCGPRVLPIDIDAIEAILRHEPHAGLRKMRAFGRGSGS
jgi:hypothetical protein